MLPKQITELIEGFVKSFDSSRPPIFEWRKAHNYGATKLREMGGEWGSSVVCIIAKEVTKYLQERADFIWEKLQSIITSIGVQSYPELNADLKAELGRHFNVARAVVEREFPAIFLSTRAPSGFAIEIARGFDNILIGINAHVDLFCAQCAAAEQVKKEKNAPTFGHFHGVFGNVTNSNITVNDFGRIYQILKNHKILIEARNEFEEIWDSLKSSSESEKHKWIDQGRRWMEKHRAELREDAGLLEKVLTNQPVDAESITITPKTFSIAYDLMAYTGGFNTWTGQDETFSAKLGIQSAALKILFYNLSPTPVILTEVKLLNAESGEIVIHQEVLTHRIDSNDSKEIELSIGSPESPYYEPPSWPVQIVVKTARNRVFSTNPFKLGGLIKNK